MVVTVKVPAVPVGEGGVSALVIAGACVDREREGLGGVGRDPVGGGDGERVGAAGPAAGVPARVAVPLPLSTKVTPAGRRPVSLRAAVGKPVVVTVKVPAHARR